MIAVLCMAYGSPRSSQEIEPYFTDIRRGRPPSREALADLAARYERIGGVSPLENITRQQAVSLEEVLNQAHPKTFKTYVGMKHWHPFISETVEQIVTDAPLRLIGLALAPHYSKMSIGGYEERVRESLGEARSSIDFHMIPAWYDEPKFVSFVAANLIETFGRWEPTDSGTKVFFTAHSLPARILEEGDPYLDQLEASSKLIADAAGALHWEFAFQSASHTREPWLGPDVLERLEAFATTGGRRAIVAPIGFVADHLEVLYDVDVECREKASALGIELKRIPSPNADPVFISALADVVRRLLEPAVTPL